MLGKDPATLWKRYKKELAEKEGDSEATATTAQAPVPTHPASGGYNVAYTSNV